MSHVDELQRKYPGIPRDMIIKWEVLRNGIRYTDVVDKVSYYDRGMLYQSRDNQIKLRDIAKERPEVVKAGFVLRTGAMYTESGFGARIIRDPSSPYEFREEKSDRYALYEGNERIDDVYFPGPRAPKLWLEQPEKEPRTSKGTPVTGLVNIRRQCFEIVPVRSCQYFSNGTQCKFCNFNEVQDSVEAMDAKFGMTLNAEETVEAYKIITSQMPPLIEGRIVMGAITNVETSDKVYLQFVERIASATTYLPNIVISSQPMSKHALQRFKDVGLSSINTNIEVWHPQLFEEVCPGKAKNRGRERYLEFFQEAVEILGWGNVGSNMPGGLTLMPENGLRSWQQARDSHDEGNRWLIQHGVIPMFQPLALGAGSVYGDNPANRDKRAPTEYYLDLALAHHEDCKEFGMYERMNRLLWCPLHCSAAGYAGELGMVEIAGDIGKWAATAMPDEANWLGRFIESFKTPAIAQ